MRKLTSVEEAGKLLHEIHQQMRNKGLLFLGDKTKNRQTLAKLGIMASRLESILYTLKAVDYCGGPEPDEKYPWKSVAVFGMEIDGVELYVKFSVGEKDAPVVCLSFHEAERPMTYQFK